MDREAHRARRQVVALDAVGFRLVALRMLPDRAHALRIDRSGSLAHRITFLSVSWDDAAPFPRPVCPRSNAARRAGGNCANEAHTLDACCGSLPHDPRPARCQPDG